MRGHGVTVVGPTVHDAFDETYTAERTCMYQMTAMQTGQPLHKLPEGLRRNHTAPGASGWMRDCTSMPGAACWTARNRITPGEAARAVAPLAPSLPTSLDGEDILSFSNIIAWGVALIGGTALRVRRMRDGDPTPARGEAPAIPAAKPQGVIPTLKMPTAQGWNEG